MARGKHSRHPSGSSSTATLDPHFPEVDDQAAYQRYKVAGIIVSQTVNPNYLSYPKVQNITYGDIVLDVVKKEFKDHVEEMENLRNVSKAKHDNSFYGDWIYPSSEEKQEDLLGEVSPVTMAEIEFVEESMLHIGSPEHHDTQESGQSRLKGESPGSTHPNISMIKDLSEVPYGESSSSQSLLQDPAKVHTIRLQSGTSSRLGRLDLCSQMRISKDCKETNYRSMTAGLSDSRNLFDELEKVVFYLFLQALVAGSWSVSHVVWGLALVVSYFYDVFLSVRISWWIRLCPSLLLAGWDGVWYLDLLEPSCLFSSSCVWFWQAKWLSCWLVGSFEGSGLQVSPLLCCLNGPFYSAGRFLKALLAGSLFLLCFWVTLVYLNLVLLLGWIGGAFISCGYPLLLVTLWDDGYKVCSKDDGWEHFGGCFVSSFFLGAFS
ncbi:hypothetical protein MA16_Dca026115 [Dendrobium catenatum]|uniref:Uncharacterized protein n=1 Tax=Dendrobium catenatum TaxID=906689 RepID=A0A2I0W4C1_9ASPA|nr:hypothetical protein MA16_Dca026115 [Dendrobium catenatum]